MKGITHLFFIQFFTLTARAQPPQADSLFQLQISVNKVTPATMAYLAYQVKGVKYLDSSRWQKGRYFFHGTTTDPINATLLLDHGQAGIQTIVHGFAMDYDLLKLYLHPGLISLKCDSLLSAAVFLQSDINKDNSELAGLLQKNTAQLVALSRQIKSEKDSLPMQLLLQQLDSLKMCRLPVLAGFISGHTQSYIALMALKEYHVAGISQKSLLFQLHLPPAALLYTQLAASLQQTPAGLSLQRMIFSDQLLQPGSHAPAFTQYTPKGKPVTLADFRGQYLLIDFWASWCQPCRQNHSALIQLYEQFRNRNFTILGIALDDKAGKKDWISAIRKDKLPWTQASDLQHWDNQVSQLYGISAIPDNVLISPEGKIITRSLNASALENKLKELLP